jgi:hypothetical protein
MSSDYSVRCPEHKVPHLTALAVELGLLKESSETPGQYYGAMWGVAWCPVGLSHDAGREPMFHANIRIPGVSLLEFAQSAYTASPTATLAAGIKTLGAYFSPSTENTQLTGSPA